MLGGLDPKKMQAMMRQMGIKQEEIEATRVIIEKSDGRIVIEPANVMKVVMQGQESWQITGPSHEEEGISEEDINMVMEKSGASKEDASAALAKTSGDIAQAIIDLS